MLFTALALNAAALPSAPVMLTHYSDAQCPCSARLPHDVAANFLDFDAGYEGLVDFNQFFVGDLKKDVHHCIHGEGECVGQRHFVCAQNMTSTNFTQLSYQDSKEWFDFQVCSYGSCKDCPAIEGAHCPCYNYTIFNDFTKNDVMKDCAAQVGLDWGKLNGCGAAASGSGVGGDALMALSAGRANGDGVTYGVDGLAPVFVNGVKVPTKRLIPLDCGPTMQEVKKSVCAALLAKGHTPAACKK